MFKLLRFAGFLLLTFSPVFASANTWNSSERTYTHLIESAILGETRTVIVRTPPSYHADREYPVVYVPDAEWNFELVASYLDYMADNDVYPDMIVTGVINVNRNRDYIPRPDPHYRDTGKADDYLSFVRDEWLSLISNNYSDSSNRVLIGHSFGGVFTLHALFSEPDLFDAYIALGSSAWIADRVLFDEAKAYFEKHPTHDAFVYMAVGENDGGPTIPSSQDLAALFELEAPPTLEWQFDITPKTDHFKNVTSGMHDAFMALFPAWNFDVELTAAARQGGVSSVDAYFADKTEKLGWRFQASWFDLGIVALTLSGEGSGEYSLAIMKHLRQHHPDSALVAEFSGMVYERTGHPADAADQYQRVIKLANSQNLHPNAIHLDRVEASLQRVSNMPDPES